MGRLLRTLAVGALLLTTGCLYIFGSVEPERLAPAQMSDETTVSTPVRAHLLDGSTVVYARGVRVVRGDRGALVGDGLRYDLESSNPSGVRRIPLDSVAAMETLRYAAMTGGDVATSVLVSAAATGAAIFGTAGLMVAVFGSCPTIYADTGATARLQAESFSYSIAPMLERRDVDPLDIRPDADGRLRLEIRNEALETHYINHLELVSAAHAADERVLPERDDRLVALRGRVLPARALDRDGRDLRADLRAADERTTMSTMGRLAKADVGDSREWIDFSFPLPREAERADTVALDLTARNSLLQTVLLYDVMLGEAGAAAVDWLARDLSRIDRMVELGRWWSAHMGMRVAVREDGEWRDVATVSDVGPIAFRRSAVLLPVRPGADTLHVRVSYTADQWRIDEVALATGVRRVEAERVPLARLEGPTLADSPLVRERLAGPDERYLVTEPGSRVVATFETAALSPAPARSWFVAAQGYYTEWLRGHWLREARRPAPFVPSDSAVVDAIRRWAGKRERFERTFHDYRVPVR